MIQIRLERFPSGTVKKLQARSASPFNVLKQMGPNAYVIDLPYDYGISSSFNIKDLVAYKSPTTIPDTPFDESLPNPIDAPIPTPLPLNLPYAHKESIDAILDEQIVSTRDGRAKRRQPNLWPYGWSLLVIGLEIKQAQAFNNQGFFMHFIVSYLSIFSDYCKTACENY